MGRNNNNAVADNNNNNRVAGSADGEPIIERYIVVALLSSTRSIPYPLVEYEMEIGRKSKDEHPTPTLYFYVHTIIIISLHKYL